MRERLDKLMREALRSLSARDGLEGLADLDPGLERARDPQHGDFASNVAMRAAKATGRAPRDLARGIVDCMPAAAEIDSVDIAGPGFVNIRLARSALERVVEEVIERGPEYGTQPANDESRVLLEYVSANPTGPLHVGHGRHAAYGASLANVLRAAGRTVDEEYYVNDAGRQMEILAASVWLRYAENLGAAIAFPPNCYQGGYVRDIAAELQAQFGGDLLGDPALVTSAAAADADGDEARLDALIAAIKATTGSDAFRTIFDAALESVLGDIREDLEEFGTSPASWYSERTLTESNAVEAALEQVRERGLLYERDGATWFRTTDFGDDKDRVVVRENGVRTYFASDIAYHLAKFDRGYDFLIDVLGSDHHGYVERLRAGVEAMGRQGDNLEVRIVQFVVLYRGETKVQMSSRAGEYVTLRELRHEVGNDAARFFYVSRSNDQHLDFDLELAKSQNRDNPVYYVQYAHARVAGMLDRMKERGLPVPDPAETKLSALELEQELGLMRHLSRYPEVIELAADNRAPQHIVHFLRDVAADFHSYYDSHRILVDDATIRDARIRLVLATQQVIRNALGLLGVSAPDNM